MTCFRFYVCITFGRVSSLMVLFTEKRHINISVNKAINL